MTNGTIGYELKHYGDGNRMNSIGFVELSDSDYGPFNVGETQAEVLNNLRERVLHLNNDADGIKKICAMIEKYGLDEINAAMFRIANVDKWQGRLKAVPQYETWKKNKVKVFPSPFWDDVKTLGADGLAAKVAEAQLAVTEQDMEIHALLTAEFGRVFLMVV